MKRVLSFGLLLVLILSGCAPGATPTPVFVPEIVIPTSVPPTSAPASRTLNVFAAASLSDAFREIGRNFEAANPGVTVTFNFAGSQALRTQIEAGAPADVFASASRTEMDGLIYYTLVKQDAIQMFLSNRLVVVVPADNPAALEDLEDLANPGVKLVLAAEDVPAGRYAREALDQMNRQFGSDFNNRVIANVVSNEDNVKQVVTKVQLGEADAGIVYASDAVAALDLETMEIPAGQNVIARYPIAPLTKSANPDLARAFVMYVLSPNGQAILREWGFSPAR